MAGTTAYVVRPHPVVLRMQSVHVKHPGLPKATDVKLRTCAAAMHVVEFCWTPRLVRLFKPVHAPP